MADQSNAAVHAERCFACGDHTDTVFGYGACSHECRRVIRGIIIGLGLAIRRFVRRAEVAELVAAIDEHAHLIGERHCEGDLTGASLCYLAVVADSDRLAELALEDR